MLNSWAQRALFKMFVWQDGGIISWWSSCRPHCLVQKVKTCWCQQKAAMPCLSLSLRLMSPSGRQSIDVWHWKAHSFSIETLAIQQQLVSKISRLRAAIWKCIFCLMLSLRGALRRFIWWARQIVALCNHILILSSY